jgi:4-amino-4-deoxy-L-arabinose transferase-like glycosyltransferase
VISNSRTLLLILVVVYFLGVFDHGLWAPMDTVGAGMIWGMHHAGSWVVPLLNGQPYLEKPPLMHWTALVLMSVTGRLSEALIRMPSALYGLGAVLIVYHWGRREQSARVGLCAAFLCTGSLLYLEYSRSVLTDASLVFVVILSMQFFWWAYSKHRDRVADFAPFLLASAVAFFAKGLVGVAFVWMPIVTFLAYRRHWRWLFLLPTLYVPLFALLVGFWAYRVWLVGGEDYLRVIFIDNQFGRFFTFSDASLPADPYFVHKEGLTYYLRDLPPRILPWVILAPAALYYWLRRSGTARSDFSVYLKFALVVMLLILHASSAKVSEYALPALPILFYLTAVWLDTALARWNSSFEKWSIVLAGLCAGLAALIPPSIIVALYLVPHRFLARSTDGIDIIRVAAPKAAGIYGFAGVALIGATIVVLANAGYRLRTDTRERLTAAFPGTITLLLTIGYTLAVQVYDPQRSCKPVADSLLQQLRQGRQIALGTDASHVTGCMTFYLNSLLPVRDTVQAAADFLENNRPAALLIEKDDLQERGFATLSDRFVVTPIDYPGITARTYALIRN